MPAKCLARPPLNGMKEFLRSIECVSTLQPKETAVRVANELSYQNICAFVVEFVQFFFHKAADDGPVDLFGDIGRKPHANGFCPHFLDDLLHALLVANALFVLLQSSRRAHQLRTLCK